MTKHVLHTFCAAMLIAAVATPVPVFADDAGGGGGGISMTVRPPDQKDPKQKGKAPAIEVAVSGGAMLTLDKYSISTTNKGVKVTMKADKLRTYVDGTETLAIAFVVAGQQVWVGTDGYQNDIGSFSGALGAVEPAIDKLQLGSIAPSGSRGLIVSYSTGAEIKATGDLKSINGAVLGGEKDYAGKLNNDLIQGITMAIGELEKMPTARKVMIVIGDGNNTNAEDAKKAFPQLKSQAQKDNIECYGVIYKSAISDPKDSSVITSMIPTAKTVPDAAGISSELTAIITHITQRYYLTFAGFDEKTGESLPWDGKEHDIVLKIDQAEQDAITLTMAPAWAPAKGGFPVWAIVLLSLLGLIFLIVIIKALTKKKEAQMPMQMPMQMQMPMPMPEAPAPKGPMKTMMVDIGGGETGIPIVGWLVPLNGANQFQTWKLKPGLTKIGTAPPSDLVVNDGFMSTEHCAISCSPAGFTLIDNGSTNGTLVNDKRVSKQELFDNDVVTMGRTNFKFKSIN